MMELGNMFFGCSRGEFPVERDIGYEGLLYVLYEKLGIEDYDRYENDVFVLRPYYWGECDCDANEGEYHKKDCSLIQPNFHHKPSGLKIKWYKHPFRDSYSNQEITLVSFFEIIHSCLQSIQGEHTMSYQIRSIEFRETDKGRAYARVQLADDKRFFSMWSDYETGEFPKGFNEGAYINADIVQKGKYWNLNNVVVQRDDSKPSGGSTAGHPSIGQYDTMILSYAKDLAMSIVTKETTTQDMMLSRVRFFYDGLQGILLGEDQEEPWDEDIPH